MAQVNFISLHLGGEFMIWPWRKKRQIAVFMIAISVFISLLSPSVFASDFTMWRPMTSSTTVDLYSVWGSASNDVFAVGSSGTIVHYDGSDWSSMSTSTTSDLYGVWGASSTNVFAVGRSGTIVHYDCSD